MTAFTIAVLPGDGIGPEVAAEGVRVLRAVGERFGHEFVVVNGLIGGAAIDATGGPLPNETVTICQESDAVLLGAVGGPQWDALPARSRPEVGLLGIRKVLGLYANLRPVVVHPALAESSPIRADRLAGVDLLVVRELTGGLYFGASGREPLHTTPRGERAFDTCVYTTEEIERVVRMAAALARGRRKKLTSVDKANVLATSRLWRDVTSRVVADEFPDVTLEHLLVDACAMHLILRPADFDVIVTENMFGDILTDEASTLAGSIGVLPSASLGASGPIPRRGLYEPIHGSAPTLAGRNVANPIGMIASVALMLRHSLALEPEAQAVEDAIDDVIMAGYRTADLIRDGNPSTRTSDVGQAVATAVNRTTMAGATRVRLPLA